MMTPGQSQQLSRAELPANLAGFRRVPLTRAELKAASVAISVMSPADGETLLVTRRARGLRTHAGQYLRAGEVLRG